MAGTWPTFPSTLTFMVHVSLKYKLDLWKSYLETYQIHGILYLMLSTLKIMGCYKRTGGTGVNPIFSRKFICFYCFGFSGM